MVFAQKQILTAFPDVRFTSRLEGLEVVEALHTPPSVVMSDGNERSVHLSLT